MNALLLSLCVVFAAYSAASVLPFHAPVPAVHEPVPAVHEPVPAVHEPVPAVHAPESAPHAPVPASHLFGQGVLTNLASLWVGHFGGHGGHSQFANWRCDAVAAIPAHLRPTINWCFPWSGHDEACNASAPHHTYTSNDGSTVEVTNGGPCYVALQVLVSGGEINSTQMASMCGAYEPCMALVNNITVPTDAAQKSTETAAIKNCTEVSGMPKAESNAVLAQYTQLNVTFPSS